MSGRFEQCPVLVTAAGAGIGAATARVFATEGARLVLSDIDRDAGETVAESLRQLGVTVHFVHADCSDENQVRELIAQATTRLGGLACAANIVGDAVGDANGPEFHRQSTAGWNGTLAVSLNSTYLCMKHEITYMLAHGGGAICNVASLAGLLYVADSGAAYSAAKAAVIQLTKFAAVTYADRGIRVNCIAPGVTPTAAWFKRGRDAGQASIDHLLQYQPIKRPIEPAEQAAAIAWLCSREAGMVTGQVLPVDGGWSAA